MTEFYDETLSCSNDDSGTGITEAEIAEMHAAFEETPAKTESFGFSCTDDDLTKVQRMTGGEKAGYWHKINQIDLRRIFPSDKRGTGFICPICDNGSGSTGDGLTPQKDEKTNELWYNCFACGKFKGSLDKILKRECKNADIALAIGLKMLTAADNSEIKNPPIAEKLTKTSKVDVEEITREIESARQQLDKLPLEDRRGLTLETLQHFGVGFVSDWVLPKLRSTKTAIPTPRIIIPTSESTYNAILTNSARNESNKPYKSMAVGEKLTFNSRDIVPSEPVILVEGEIDAMSIYQATGGKVRVAAIGGASLRGKFLKTLYAQISHTARAGYSFIVLMDNDNAGRVAARELVDKLNSQGYHSVSKFLSSSVEKVDANDILVQENGETALKQAIDAIVSSAKIDAGFRQASGSNEKVGIAELENLVNKEKQKAQEAEEARLKRIVAEIAGGILIKTADVAQRLGVSSDTVKKWRKRKLFGVPFFTADVKYGQDWYYYKERVEQLAAVYQKGVLSNMYKLARKFEGEILSDYFHFGGTSRNIAKVEPQFFPADEVAQILDTTEMQLSRWRESKIFAEDLQDHDGTYWYSAARVYEMKGKRDAASEGVNESARQHTVDVDKATEIQRAKDIETFDSETVFKVENIRAAAYAFLYDASTFNELEHAIKKCGTEHPADKVRLTDWKRAVKDASVEIKQKEFQQLKAHSTSYFEHLFFGTPFYQYSVPEGYIINQSGIYKLLKDKPVPVCNSVVIIDEIRRDVKAGTLKNALGYVTATGKYKKLPPRPASEIFDARSIVKLTDYGLPTSSAKASLLVDYLDAFKTANAENIPETLTVERGGWHTFDGKEVFVDPRISVNVMNGDKLSPLKIDSESEFVIALTSKGSMQKWNEAYALAKTSPVARLMVAASLMSPLLKILGERIFYIHVKAHTRAGKTTALLLGASAVGTEKIVRSYDATKNGLAGWAAESSDYPLLIDEKQAADPRILAQMTELVYSIANGVGRTKLNKDSSVRDTANWRTIAISTGETDLLPANATGGAHTRCIQINAPKTILPPDTCKKIRDIIKDNYGLVFPLIIDQIAKCGVDYLQTTYENLQRELSKEFSNYLPDYCRCMAMVALMDFILNARLGVDKETAAKEALDFVGRIFEFIPPLSDIDDTPREIAMVNGFITTNQNCFIDGGDITVDKMRKVYGRFDLDGVVYITVDALKLACTGIGKDKEEQFDYRKVVSDLIAAKAFEPSTTIPKGRSKPYDFLTVKIGKVPTRCYKFVKFGA